MKSSIFVRFIANPAQFRLKCEKVPDLSNLRSNLTHFGAKPTIPDSTVFYLFICRTSERGNVKQTSHLSVILYIYETRYLCIVYRSNLMNIRSIVFYFYSKTIYQNKCQSKTFTSEPNVFRRPKIAIK